MELQWLGINWFLNLKKKNSWNWILRNQKPDLGLMSNNNITKSTSAFRHSGIIFLFSASVVTIVSFNLFRICFDFSSGEKTKTWNSVVGCKVQKMIFFTMNYSNLPLTMIGFVELAFLSELYYQTGFSYMFSHFFTVLRIWINKARACDF